METGRYPFALSVIALVTLGGVPVQAADPLAPAGLAMESIFSPDRAPANKTMGLTQRSFLDLLEQSRPELEIALVVDGTDSMRDSLAGIKATLGSMIEDLRMYKGPNLRLQIVVYRDSGSKEGEVSFPLKEAGKKFTADTAALKRAIDSIEASSGAPYFPELIDLGIEAAISQLEWSKDADTSKWLLVFGDAPPYSASFKEDETGAQRRVSTEQLVSQANRNGIKVNCVLCTSREEDRPAYEAVLDDLRTFMGSLSTATDGLMLDLSYPDIRQAIEHAGRKPRIDHQDVGHITDEEVQNVRDRAAREKSSLSRDRRVRVAILPHLPLDKMSFNSELPEVQLATDLRQRLRRIPGVQIESSGIVRRQLEALASQGVANESLLTTLAAMLKVDYVIWGKFDQEQDLVRIESSIYNGTAGQAIVRNEVRANPAAMGEATNDLVRGMVNKAARIQDDQRLASTLAVLRTTPAIGTELVTRVSNSSEVEGPLLTGYDLLEQALAYQAGEKEAEALLTRAEGALTAAVGPQGDSQNGFGYMLLANCYFNQSMALANQKDDQAAAEKMQLFRGAMNQAYQFRNRVPIEADRAEVEADFALFIKRDVPGAIKAYSNLTGQATDAAATVATAASSTIDKNAAAAKPTKSNIRSHSALRAHWMLAGIYAGDWQVAKSFVDANRARAELTRVLALWPESSEANYIRTHLRWNDETGQSEFTHFPHQHQPVSQLLGTDPPNTK